MTKRLLAALLAALLTLSLAACNKDNGNNNGKVDIPTTQTGTDDFQKNLHQSEKLSFVETDTGYYFSSESLYYIEKETMNTTIVCAKPDCDHTDDNVCNARITAYYLLNVGNKVNYVTMNYNNGVRKKLVQSVNLDATDRQIVQELKFKEISSSSSSYDQAIYHRGYIYYISDDILYRVVLGGEKDDAEIVWNPERTEDTEILNGYPVFTGNSMEYTLWADGDLIYFMVNVQDADGLTRYSLFAFDLTDKSVRQVWVTPSKDEVGEWETTGVKVSQWYVMGGYIYFYLSGGDFWRGDLSTGKNEKLADVHEKAQYGSAVFSDDYLCVLNDIPVGFYGETEPTPGGMFRYYGDTIFVYALDGTYIKEISLTGLFDDPSDMAQIDMLFCSGNDIFFLTTGMSVTEGAGPFAGLTGHPGAVNLCCADIETGEVEVIYNFRKG